MASSINSSSDNAMDPNQGESVTITILFCDKIPIDAKYYKIFTDGWKEIPWVYGSDEYTIKIILTDGDSATDMDKTKNGTIVDPSTLALPAAGSSGDGGGGSFLSGNGGGSNCFISIVSQTRK